RPACTVEPSLDRLGEATPGRSDRAAVESDATATHEHRDGIGPDFGIDGDLGRSGELRSVGHSLAHREYELACGVVELGVTRARELYWHAVQLLHICRSVRERRDYP